MLRAVVLRTLKMARVTTRCELLLHRLWHGISGRSLGRSLGCFRFFPLCDQWCLGTLKTARGTMRCELLLHCKGLGIVNVLVNVLADTGEIQTSTDSCCTASDVVLVAGRLFPSFPTV